MATFILFGWHFRVLPICLPPTFFLESESACWADFETLWPWGCSPRPGIRRRSRQGETSHAIAGRRQNRHRRPGAWTLRGEASLQWAQGRQVGMPVGGGAGTREATTHWEAETAAAGPFCPLLPLPDLPHFFFFSWKTCLKILFIPISPGCVCEAFRLRFPLTFLLSPRLPASTPGSADLPFGSCWSLQMESAVLPLPCEQGHVP